MSEDIKLSDVLVSGLESFGIELITKGIGFVYCKAKKAYRVNKSFSKACEAMTKVLENPEQAENFKLWIKHDLKSFYKAKIDKMDLNDFITDFKERLRSKLEYYYIPAEYLDVLCNAFVEEAIAYFKSNNPTLYHTYELEKIEAAIYNQELKQDELKNSISLLLNEYNQIYTIEQYESEFLPRNKSTKIGLNYFEVDDEDFLNYLPELLESDAFTIIHYDQDESVGCLLNTLRLMHIEKPVLIIKNEQSWSAIQKKELNGYILIADFYSKTIPSINNNVCIFFQNKPCPGRSINLRRRKISTLKSKLIQEGISEEYAIRLIKDTNGFYYAIKANLFRGIKTENYGQINISPSLLKTLLFFNGWCRNEMDEQKVHEQSGLDVREFNDSLNILCTLPHPFLMESINYGDKRICLTSIHVAWYEYGNLFTKEDFSEFCFSSIHFFTANHTTNEDAFRLDRTKKISEYFLEHILQSVNFVVNVYCKEWQDVGDSFIKRLLTLSLQKNDLVFLLSKYTHVISEISPKSFLDFINQHSSVLKELCKTEKEKGVTPFSFPFIGHLLGGVEQILRYGKDFIFSAFHILMKISTWDVEYENYSPHSKDLLNYIFCPFFNFTGIDIQTKKQLICQLQDKFPENSWRTLFNATTSYSGPVIPVGETYRLENIEMSVTYSEISEIMKMICPALLDTKNANQSISLIKNFEKFAFSQSDFEKTINILKQQINTLPDSGKVDIEIELRRFVFHKRFYENKLNEQYKTMLNSLTNLINEIQYNNKYYGLFYLFLGDSSQFYLLDPTPYRDSNHEEENQAKYLALLHNELFIHKNKKFILTQFLEYKGNSAINEYEIARILASWSSYKFKKTNFNICVDLNLKDAASSYASICLIEDKKKIDFAKTISDSQIKGNILRNCRLFSDDLVNELLSSNEDVRIQFWTRYGFEVESAETVSKIITTFPSKELSDECLCFVLRNSQFFEDKFILTSLSNNSAHLLRDTSSNYWAGEYLKSARGRIENSEELLAMASTIEVLLQKSSPDESYYYTVISLLKHPEEYCDILSYCFKNKLREKEVQENPNLIRIGFDMYFRLHFCPGNKIAGIITPGFNEWTKIFFNVGEQKYGFDHKSLHHYLSALLPFSNANPDGYPLSNEVREYIEENYDDSLSHAFLSAESNKRGIHNLDDGTSEKVISMTYKEKALYLQQKGFINCSQLYFDMCDDYLSESKHNRSRAENEPY